MSYENWSDDQKATFARAFPKSKKAKALMRGEDFVSKENADRNRILDYLRNRYPRVIWFCDLAGETEGAGAKAPDLRAVGFTTPDLIIDQPNMSYGGLRLELKRTDFKLYRRDGKIYSNEHIRRQAMTLALYREKGYWADFASGYEDAVLKIDAYLGGNDMKLHLYKILKSLEL